MDDDYRNRVLTYVRRNGLALEFTSFKRDPEVVIEAIQQNIEALQYVPTELYGNFDVMSIALKKNSRSFELASHELKCDRQFIAFALSIVNGAASSTKIIQHFLQNEELKNDRDLIMSALSQNGLLLEFLPEDLKDDKEIVLAAVKVYGMSLKFASITLRNDHQIIEIALKNNYKVFNYLSNELKNNLNIFLIAIDQSYDILLDNIEICSEFRNYKDVIMIAWKSLQKYLIQKRSLNSHKEYLNQFAELASNFLNDYKFCFELINDSAYMFRFLSQELQNDPEIVLHVVQKDGTILVAISDNISNYYQIVLTAVNQNGDALKYASDVMKNDYEIVWAAVNQNGYALKHASDFMKNNYEIVWTAINQNGDALKYASDFMKNDRDIVFRAVKQSSTAFRHGSHNLKNDQDLAYLAIINNDDNIFSISQELLNNYDFMIKAIKHNSKFLQYASDNIKSNRDIAMSILINHHNQLNSSSKSIPSFNHISMLLRNDFNFMNKAIKINPVVIFHLSLELRRNIKFILLNVDTFSYLISSCNGDYFSFQIWDHYDIAYAFVMKNWKHLYNITYRLQFNSEILIEAISQSRDAITLVNWKKDNFNPFYQYVFKRVKNYTISLSDYINTILCSSSSPMITSTAGGGGGGGVSSSSSLSSSSSSLSLSSVNTKASVSHLSKLSLLGPYLSSQVKKHIAEYAGVKMGIRWKKLNNTLKRIQELHDVHFKNCETDVGQRKKEVKTFISYDKLIDAWRDYSINRTKRVNT